MAGFLYDICECSVFVFKKFLLDLVGPEADYKLIFEPIIELVSESAIDGRMTKFGEVLVD